MKTECVCETHIPAHLQEFDVARRWWTLPIDILLPLSDGDSCQLLANGRPGGPQGPDVRDAMLRFSTRRKSLFFNASWQDENKVVGDVEFHIRSSDWFAHQHHTDTHYNNVILHVVLICDDTPPALRQDGTSIPTCSLYDLPYIPHQPTSWPCHHIIQQMSPEERTHLLRHAGLLRFEQKTTAFLEFLHNAQPSGPFSAYDACLIPALAEALAYGRDRSFFRAVGLRLIGIPDALPEPSGSTADPAPLDANRLHILHKLVQNWRTTGAWPVFRQALACHVSDNVANGLVVAKPRPVHSLHEEEARLRAIFEGLNTARTDILICNVVLPFAAAIAQLEDDTPLAKHARILYISYPALSSNSITRAMCKQLQLTSEPRSACQQQGLHYIYAQTCREKRCEACIVGKQNV